MAIVSGASVAAVMENSPGDTASEQAFRLQVRDWLEANLPARWRAHAPDHVEPGLDERIEWERRLHAAGFACVAWPKVYGGHGLSLAEHLIVNEELGTIGAWESVSSQGKEMIGTVVLAVGTEEQKLRLLPAIAEMREVWCQGFSEPEAGSDLAALTTRAEPDGDGWIVNGHKIWTSTAHRAHWCLLLARTGPIEKKHGSLTLFAMPMHAAGIELRPIARATGRADFCEMFLTNVRLPAGSNIGAVNDGWMSAVKVLENERATNRMYRSCRFENELRHLIAACRTDPATLALLGESHYRQRIAQLFAEILALRRHVRYAVREILDGRPIGIQGSVMKLHWSEAHRRFTDLAVELLDRAAVPNTQAIAAARRRFNELYVHVQSETVQAGTTEVQLDLIARRGLGLGG